MEWVAGDAALVPFLPCGGLAEVALSNGGYVGWFGS
jgi:hypothetical protein